MTRNPILDAPFDRPTTYEDAWLQATIEPSGGAWRLKWGDGQEVWYEYFPEDYLARRRLAELVGLDHEAGDVLTPIKEFFQAQLGHGWYLTWKRSQWHEFMTHLAASGPWDPEMFNTGGGIEVVQVVALDGALVVWCDDNEGYPRMGIYSVNLDNEMHDEGAMVSWHEDEKLGVDHAIEVDRILRQICQAAGYYSLRSMAAR